jgi:beta-lactamase regulating signal transducer with metallopeptidase domain
MMERMLLEYLANSIWQVPLLAGSAWLAIRIGRPGPRLQHWAWLSVLGLAVLLPLHGMTPSENRNASTTREVNFAGMGDGGSQVDSKAEVRLESTRDVASVSARAEHDDTSLPAGRALRGASDQANHRVTWVEGQGAAVGDETTAVADRPVGGFNVWDWLALASQVRALRLSPEATHRLAVLYLASMVLAMVRLWWNWRAIRRMVSEASPANLPEDALALLRACCERWGLRLPEVLISENVLSPVVVGIKRQVLLLPESFAHDFAEREQQDLAAVWWHELAHVRRRDYLANLVCRVLALPTAYHPATYWVDRRVRQTREIVCDAMAAAEMDSSVGYARCLVGLAQQIHLRSNVGLGMGLNLLGRRVLEERVMELIGTKAVMSGRMRAVRLAGGAAMMLGVMAATATFHVTPTMAQAGDANSRLRADAGSTVVQQRMDAETTSVVNSQINSGTDAQTPSVNSQSAATPPPAPVQRTAIGTDSHGAPIYLAKVQLGQSMNVSGVVVRRSSIAPAQSSSAAQAEPTVTPSPLPAPSPISSAQPTPAAAPAPDPHPSPERQARPSATVKPLVTVSPAIKVTPMVKVAPLTKVTPMVAVRRFSEVQAAPTRPAAPVAPTSPVTPQAPVPPVAPKAPAKPNEPISRGNDGVRRELTPEQRAQVEKAVADAKQRIQNTVNSPEFKQQVEQAHKQAEEAIKKMQDPAFQKSIGEAKSEALAATRKLNSEEMRKQMDITRQQMQATIDSPEFKKQIQDATSAAAKVNTPEMRRQIAEAMSAVRDIYNDDFRKQMDEIRDQVETAAEALRAARGDMQQKEREVPQAEREAQQKEREAQQLARQKDREARDLDRQKAREKADEERNKQKEKATDSTEN